MIKASILLITYNHESYILDAIQSITHQKYNSEIEIICLDDASQDRTVELASGILQGLPGARIVTNEKNLGITKNYQKGFELCSGKYVFVLEGDDFWLDSSKVQRQVDFLEQQPFCSMCFHPYLIQSESSGEVYNPSQINNAGFDFFAIHDLILNEGLIGNFSVCCYRKEFLNMLPPAIFETVSYDWMINIAMAQYGLLGRINRLMSIYRLSQTGVWSNKQLNEKLNDTIKLIPEYDRILGHKYTVSFQRKVKLLQEQTKEKDSNSTSFRSLVPPVFLYLIKLLIPPALLRVFKAK